VARSAAAAAAAAAATARRDPLAVQRAPSPDPQQHEPPQPGPSGPQPSADPAAQQATARALAAAVRDEVEAEFVRRHAPELSGWATAPDHAEQYRKMVRRGSLWQQAGPKDASGAPVSGRGYIAHQSAENVTAMSGELGTRPGAWQEETVRKLRTALGARVLHHYTNDRRVEEMFRGAGGPREGELKSMDSLFRDETWQGNHNTGTGDEAVLADTGFVFFFIDRPGAPFRDSRFTAGGRRPARVTVPMSALVRDGWVMLTDFLEQDHQVIRADRDGHTIKYRNASTDTPEEHMADLQWEISRCWEADPDLDDEVNHLAGRLARALRADPDRTPTREILRMVRKRAEVHQLFDYFHRQGEPVFRTPYRELAARFDRHAATSLRFNRQVRRFDPDPTANPPMGGAMRHINGAASEAVSSGPGAAALVQRYREHLSGNILAGPHIVPGLALRGALEISRIEAAGGNEPLADRLKAMPGDELADLLLRTFVRPQAMLPWSVRITRDDVEYAP
jgi:hypothetical protein